MRRSLVFLLLVLPFTAKLQTRADSVHLVKQFASYLSLKFTDSEADSLLESTAEFREAYAQMHALPLSNQARYPFAFEPAPLGFKKDTKQQVLKFPLVKCSLPANRSELAFYPVSKLAYLIRERMISSTDLTRFFIERLRRYGDSLHCVISLTEQIAMQQARQADEELKRGIYHGPLHGIPYGLKDLFAVKRTRTTWGSTPYKDQVIDEDAFVYTRLRKAGAVLCAKLSMGALAFADLWFGGRTRNPWNTDRGSSGSSAGSASAVSAGLLPFAIGTETWGSIVSPTHTCGVTGLRPSFGSVSRSGAMVLCWSLDKIGPICRNASDAAIVFYYIKGTDGADPSATDHAFNYNSNKPLNQLRIAYAEDYFSRLSPKAMEHSVLKTFTAAGVALKKVNMNDSLLYPADIMNPIISAESAAAFDELTRSDRDELIERQDKNFWPNIFRASRFIPAVEYINANRLRYALIEKMDSLMSGIDVLIVPTYSGAQSAITNLTGHPVITIPIGLNNSGLPNSITLIGKLYDEATILRAAAWFQEQTSFDELHPPKFK